MAVPQGTPIPAIKARFQVNGVNLNLNEYNVAERAADLESTNYESVDPATGDTYEEGVMGKLGADITFRGFWDGSICPSTNPPNLRPGQTLSNVKLFIDKTSNNRAYNFPSFRMLQFTVRAVLDQLVFVDGSGKSNGTYTRPQ